MELSEIAKNVVERCKEYINSCMTTFDEKIKAAVDSVRTEFKEAIGGIHPAPQVTAEDVAKMVSAEIAKIPAAKDGKSVDEDQVQKMIAAAVNQAVEALPKAKDGEDGKDAAHLEILAEIDTDKSYRRGQWAHHKGGLWRSFEKTAGMRGWECVVEGIEAITVSGECRNVKISITKSSGAIVEKEVAMPVMVYCGIYQEGHEYKHGDTVTWGGSVWHCNKDTNERPGTACTDWTLAVKRGRDGKGEKGAPGLPGKPGKPAKDLRFLQMPGGDN